MEPKGLSRLRRSIVGLIKLMVGLGLVCYLLAGSWNDIRRHSWGEVNWGLMLAAFCTLLAATALTFYRWYLLVRALELPFTVRESMRLGFIGVFFNLLIPGAVGGDVVKAVLVARQQQRRTAAVASVLVDRIVGLIGLATLAGLVVLVSWKRLSSPEELARLARWTLVVMLGISLASAFLFTSSFSQMRIIAWAKTAPFIGPIISELVDALQSYAVNPTVVVVGVLISVLGHIGFISTLWFSHLALPYATLPWHVHFVVSAIGLMIGAIPITPGGLGLAEGAMQVLFELVGGSKAGAIIMMLAYRTMQVLVACIGLVYYLVSRSEIGEQLAAAG